MADARRFSVNPAQMRRPASNAKDRRARASAGWDTSHRRTARDRWWIAILRWRRSVDSRRGRPLSLFANLALGTAFVLVAVLGSSETGSRPTVARARNAFE